jgi:hypothetical protein
MKPTEGGKNKKLLPQKITNTTWTITYVNSSLRFLRCTPATSRNFFFSPNLRASALSAGNSGFGCGCLRCVLYDSLRSVCACQKPRFWSRSNQNQSGLIKDQSRPNKANQNKKMKKFAHDWAANTPQIGFDIGGNVFYAPPHLCKRF